MITQIECLVDRLPIAACAGHCDRINRIAVSGDVINHQIRNARIAAPDAQRRRIGIRQDGCFTHRQDLRGTLHTGVAHGCDVKHAVFRGVDRDSDILVGRSRFVGVEEREFAEAVNGELHLAVHDLDRERLGTVLGKVQGHDRFGSVQPLRHRQGDGHIAAGHIKADVVNDNRRFRRDFDIRKLFDFLPDARLRVGKSLIGDGQGRALGSALDGDILLVHAGRDFDFIPLGIQGCVLIEGRCVQVDGITACPRVLLPVPAAERVTAARQLVLCKRARDLTAGLCLGFLCRRRAIIVQIERNGNCARVHRSGIRARIDSSRARNIRSDRCQRQAEHHDHREHQG